MSILEQRTFMNQTVSRRSHYYQLGPKFSTLTCKAEKANTVDWLEWTDHTQIT